MTLTKRHAVRRTDARTLVGPVLLVPLAFALAGCMSFGPSNRVAPLQPVPTTSVSSTALPQPITTQTQQTAPDGQLLDEFGQPIAADGTVESASLGAPLEPVQAPTGGTPLDEDDLIGVWSASTPVATCSINLSLTGWQGGYRASTRNCADVQLASLSAWQVEGQQLFLKDAEGATLARLFPSGAARYAGQLESGGAVTVFR